MPAIFDPPLVRVIGVGNPLMGDDGIGVALVQRLSEEDLPSSIEVVDGGTAGLTLLDLMEGAAAVIVVDAADLGLPAGEIVRVTGEDIFVEHTEAAFSLHESGLEGALALGRELEILPPLVLYLVQGARVEPVLELSKSIEDALEILVARVKAEALSLSC